MAKYRVDVSIQGQYYIEADSPEQAEELASKRLDTLSFPTEEDCLIDADFLWRAVEIDPEYTYINGVRYRKDPE